jgi:hypothetical protein
MLAAVKFQSSVGISAGLPSPKFIPVGFAPVKLTNCVPAIAENNSTIMSANAVLFITAPNNDKPAL